MSEAIGHLRGWLAQLDNPDAREAATELLGAVLRDAREGGRREGFEKARERAAQRGHGYIEALATRHLRCIMNDADALAAYIRAMQDGAGEGTCTQCGHDRHSVPCTASRTDVIAACGCPYLPEEETCGRLCDCTGAPHRAEEGCP